MGLNKEAETIEKSIFTTIEEGKFLTGDLGGKSGTKEFTQAIIGNLKI